MRKREEEAIEKRELKRESLPGDQVGCAASCSRILRIDVIWNLG